MFEEIGGGSPAALDGSEPAYRRWVLREKAAHRFYGFVVEARSHGVVGSGVVWLQPSQPRPAPLDRLVMPYIMSMYTDPGYRGRGVASLLVRRMVRWATDRGYRRIVLHASKHGRPVYERLGFESTN
jgi:GNAT superfamily N-acetyltransferase